MQIEFDKAKSEKNRAERGFGFELALRFDFATALTIRDDRADYGEDRFRAWGRIDGTPYQVAFTFRGNAIRIISMRRTHEKEAKRYGI